MGRKLWKLALHRTQICSQALVQTNAGRSISGSTCCYAVAQRQTCRTQFPRSSRSHEGSLAPWSFNRQRLMQAASCDAREYFDRDLVRSVLTSAKSLRWLDGESEFSTINVDHLSAFF